jgi:hypothetical protein
MSVAVCARGLHRTVQYNSGRDVFVEFLFHDPLRSQED